MTVLKKVGRIPISIEPPKLDVFMDDKGVYYFSLASLFSQIGGKPGNVWAWVSRYQTEVPDAAKHIKEYKRENGTTTLVVPFDKIHELLTTQKNSSGAAKKTLKDVAKTWTNVKSSFKQPKKPKPTPLLKDAETSRKEQVVENALQFSTPANHDLYVSIRA